MSSKLTPRIACTSPPSAWKSTSRSLTLMTGALHSDYCRLNLPRVDAVAMVALADPVREILQTGTIYAHAESHPSRRSLAGRGPAYAIPLGPERAVVRHVRHGGLLASLTSDLFLAPTRHMSCRSRTACAKAACRPPRSWPT